jgi:hypothetical protein
MQVNDSPGAAPGGRALEPEVPHGAEGAPSARRGRSKQGFRKALEGAPADGGDADGFASTAALAGWFRLESAFVPARSNGGGAAGSARPVDRILIGAGPDGAQARIRIAAGALAGTEIQLSSVAGRAVEAQVLTHASTSRQTLSMVMDEIRSRLLGRGIVLRTRPAAAPAPARAGDVSRGDVNAAAAGPVGSAR